ncbi:MAG: hypothetical protein ACKO7M_03690 [Acinetobacter junii]
MKKPTYDELVDALSIADHKQLRMKYAQLKQRVNELDAQVEQLRQRNNELEIMQPSYNLIRNAFYNGACWFDGTINNGTLALDKAANVYANEKLSELTLTQCLADVKAQEFRSGYISALITHTDEPLTWCEKQADEHISKLLKGE